MARIKYKEAVGLTAKPGRPSLGKRPDKKDLILLYVKEGKSIRVVANILGCSKDMVKRALNEYGIKTRSEARGGKSVLYNYSLDEIIALIEKKGKSGAARELGVHESTLRYHLKKRKE